MNTQTVRFSRVMFAAMAASTVIAHAQGGGYCPPSFPDNRNATSAALGAGTLGVAWASTRDVGSHLYRNRAGIRPGSHIFETEAPVVDSGAKGGMGSAKVAAVAVPRPNRWQVFGSLYFYSEDRDGDGHRPRERKRKKHHKYHDRYDLAGMVGGRGIPGVAAGTADTSLEVYGGSVGIEYHFNRNWSAGLALSASSGELRMGSGGASDIDSVSLIPYVSYYQADAFGSADLWGSLMYGYGMHSIDTARFTGGIASGSTDADTHTLEFNIGLNFGERDFVHGPYAGLRYVTGSIDAYTEVGPGAAFFGEQDVDSLVSILGYQMSWRIRGNGGIWVPQLRLAWEHEFEDGNVSAFGIPVNSYDEDLAVVGAGIGYWWDNGWNLGVDYEGRFGSNTSGHYGGIRAGKEF